MERSSTSNYKVELVGGTYLKVEAFTIIKHTVPYMHLVTKTKEVLKLFLPITTLLFFKKQLERTGYLDLTNISYRAVEFKTLLG